MFSLQNYLDQEDFTWKRKRMKDTHFQSRQTNRDGTCPPAWKSESAIQNMWNNSFQDTEYQRSRQHQANPKKWETDDMNPMTVPASRPMALRKKTKEEASTTPELKRCIWETREKIRAARNLKTEYQREEAWTRVISRYL